MIKLFWDLTKHLQFSQKIPHFMNCKLTQFYAQLALKKTQKEQCME